MEDKDKTKEQLIRELEKSRKRNVELETLEIEHKRIMDVLQKNEERFRGIVENSVAGYFHIDNDGLYQRVNDTWLKMHGYSSPDEVIGKHFSLTQVDSDLEETQKIFESILSGKSIPYVEFSRRLKDGSIGYHIFSAKPVVENEKIMGLEGFLIDTTERKILEEEKRDARRQHDELVNLHTEELTMVNERLQKEITERKKTEEELHETRNYLDNLLNYANAPIIVWDPKFRITRFNYAFERFTGYTADEVISKKLHILFPSESKDDSIGKIESTLKGEYWESVEIPILCKNGEVRLALWNSANIYAEDGTTLIATIAQGIDITERNKAEQALLESEENYRELAESISDVFYAMDKDLRYIFWNKASEKLTGIAAKEAIGKTIFDIFPDTEDTRRAISVYQEVLKTQQPQNFINDYQLGGKTYFFEINAYPSKKGLSVFVKDITEQKKAEEELRISEKKYRDLTETTSDLIWEVDKEGVYIYISPKLEEFLGYEVSEVLGKPAFDFMSEEEKKKIGKIYENSVMKEKPFWGLQNIMLHKDGHPVILESNGVPFFDEKGRLKGYRGIDRDITKRKKAEEDLIESEEKYRNIVEINPYVIYQLDDKGIITFISKRIEEITGYESEELIGKNISEIVHKEDLNKIRLINERRTGNRAIRRLELRFKGKDGIKHIEIRWIGVNATGVYKNGYNGDGEIESRGELKGEYVGTHGTITDITERKKMEAYKKATHEISRILLEGKTNKTLDTVLEELGKESNSSRTYIFEFDQTKKFMSNTYEWVNPDELKSKKNPDGIEAQIENLQDLPMDIFPKRMAILKKNEVINSSNIYEYDFDESLRNSLEEQGIKSILIVPLYYIAFHKTHKWLYL